MTEVKNSTWLNALIGAVATVVLSFTIVSPILGGALSGYLEQGNGVRVGAIAGVIAALPVLLIALAFMGLIPAIGSGFSGFEIAVSGVVFFAIPIFIIGLSCLGGYLGVYLRTAIKG